MYMGVCRAAGAPVNAAMIVTRCSDDTCIHDAFNVL